ncbi:MAG: type II toxin-antitoxin system tRNA(fMet)-specific endonuclease VapC [Terracidiphilus sp.]
MKYLLDTNACIALINNSSEKVRRRFVQAERDQSSIAISTIVLHELHYGVAKSEQASRNARALDEFLHRNIAQFDFNSEDARAAAEIRAGLERKGRRIGEYDTLIAGQALARNMVLVTANTREFVRVKGLVVEDWSV